MKVIETSTRANFVTVVGLVTEDGVYCLDCVQDYSYPEDVDISFALDNAYPDGYTCIDCADVVTIIKGEQQ
jgi:hypothetical protein